MNMFMIFCLIISVKSGNRINKIYSTVKCSSNGLVMTKICEILIILMLKNDKLSGICYLTVHVYSPCKIECL